MATALKEARPKANKDVQKALAQRLARYKISDAAVARIADRVIKDGVKIGRWDFCPYGICIDYFADKRILVDKLFASDRTRVVKLFPYGIPFDDFWHVHAEIEVPELAEARFG